MAEYATQETRDRIDNVFTHHPPTEDQIPRYEEIRRHGRQFAICIDSLVPNGPEKKKAMEALREVVMWANAGIACGE